MSDRVYSKGTCRWPSECSEYGYRTHDGKTNKKRLDDAFIKTIEEFSVIGRTFTGKEFSTDASSTGQSL